MKPKINSAIFIKDPENVSMSLGIPDQKGMGAVWILHLFL